MTKPEIVYFPSWAAGRAGYAERVREVFQNYLKKKDLVYTEQRDAILTHLLQSDRHLTQEDIYRDLKNRGLGKVTVFRTLKLLEECRVVEAVEGSDGRARYEVKIERPHHDHLVCLACGAITEIQWPDVEQAQEKACRKLGFEIFYHRHELFGRCATCAAPRP